MTGPVARFARQIAGHGYIAAAPSSYHEFTGLGPLAYDEPGTDEGNAFKIKKVRMNVCYSTSVFYLIRGLREYGCCLEGCGVR